MGGHDTRRPVPDALRRRLDPSDRYGLRLTLFAVAVVLVAVPFGLLLDQVVREGPLTRADTAAANRLHEWVRGRPWAVDVLQVVSFLGGVPWLTAMVGAAAVYALRRMRWRLVVFLLATTLSGGAINTVVKVTVDRDRPSLVPPVASAKGRSFPSGHAMSSTVAYGCVLLVLLPVIPRPARRTAVAGVGAVVLAIGVSRLALGVHYLSDVAGGYALGLGWLSASTAAFSTWRIERGLPGVHPIEGVEG